MKRNVAYIFALCFTVFLCVLGIHRLTGGAKHFQSYIESILPKKEENSSEPVEWIRVLLKTDGFRQITHPEVVLQASSELICTYGQEEKRYEPNEQITISPNDERFQTGVLRIRSVNPADKIQVVSLERAGKHPEYRGTLELRTTQEGIVMINELLLEQYLYAVVPSEMPASFEQEALKAQAVCARSYAYCQTREFAYPEYEAHVDDSTSFQVYGNSEEQQSTIRAVDETKGQVLWYKGQVVTAYYYSTSSGTSASIRAWGGEFSSATKYLQSVDICDEQGNAYEKDLPWYKWKATISSQCMEHLIELNGQQSIGTLETIKITKRGDGGIVQQVVARGSSGSITVETENKIRRLLGGDGYVIQKQDGTEVDSTTLLPSAFFDITYENGNYILTGGGYGHGIGMSQNGANEMAKQGKTYQNILEFFYTGVTIQ